ncbi:MAG: methyltransferase domain-containing protein [Alistipes sp.]|nr:methyltransferase domain-containing protein [Alistipes sp.]
MTAEERDILLREDVLAAIDAAIERDAVRIALDSRIPHAREVATQVKYLQRAKSKLPRMYAARCIIPPRAFEQSSSEQCAAAKQLKGRSLLDLTCGLGVDAASLAQSFERVVALERDEVLASITRENLRRQGIKNVEVVNASAEEYLATCTDHFDWLYADPDRRTADGRRVVRLEDCSPNMLAIWSDVKRVAECVAIKNSPLFDVDEAFRLFGDCRVEVVSMGGECKEVMIYVDGSSPTLAAESVGGERYEVSRAEALAAEPMVGDFAERMGDYNYLIIPDVALQKARLVVSALRGKADVWSNNSFGFAVEPVEGLLGRTERISRIEEYDPKQLKRQLKGQGVEIIMRDFPISLDDVRRKCSLRSGNSHRIALTRIGGKNYVVWLG